MTSSEHHGQATSGLKRSYDLFRDPTSPVPVSSMTSRSFSPLNMASIGPTSNNSSSQTSPKLLQTSLASQELPVANTARSFEIEPYPSPTALFPPDTSLVIIGFPGTGKSTLAIIAALATQRRIIESEDYFERVVGCSASRLKESQGISHFREKRREVLQSMLVEYEKNCILVWNFGGTDGSEKLLRDFAAHHPVIYITRDTEDVQSHIRTTDILKIRKLLSLSGSIYRSCSNLEFYNLSERQSVATSSDSRPDTVVEGSYTSRMMLKQVEQDFLAFLNAFMVQHANGQLNAESPLVASQPLEQRMYTYALVIPLSVLIGRGVDFDEMESAMDAIEILVDFNTAEKTQLGVIGLLDIIGKYIAIIRRKLQMPIILAVQNDTEAGLDRELFNVDEYFHLLHFGLRFSPEYLVVNIADSTMKDKIQQLISRKRTTKIIGHVYDGTEREDGWCSRSKLDQYECAMEFGCDIVRLCQPAFSAADNISVLHFAQRVRDSYPNGPPLIAYNNNSLGRMSCCFNTTITPVTHPRVMPTSQTMITSRAAQEALYSSFIQDRLSFWIFGGSVDYSLSPAMHNAAYRLYGMPHEYKICQTSTIKDLERLVKDPSLGGVSITLPYKNEVIPLLDSISSSAKIIGAVNTIVPLREVPGVSQSINGPKVKQRLCSGKIIALHGENTDWVGITTCIQRSLSPANAVGARSSSVVIGAGGMARASVYALIKLGVQNIVVVNRTVQNAETLANHYNNLEIDLDKYVQGFNAHLPSYVARGRQSAKFHVHVLETLEAAWPDGVAYPTIIVSTVPVHQIDGVAPPHIVIPPEWLRSTTGGVVIELAYKNTNTALFRQFQEKKYHDWVFVGGLEVLPEQGYSQFEMFTGRRAPRRLMRAEVLKCYDRREASREASMNLSS